MNNETTVKHLLRSAASEIKELRSENQHMSARLTMFDDMMLLFKSGPYSGSVGMKEDIVYQIDKFLIGLAQD